MAYELNKAGSYAFCLQFSISSLGTIRPKDILIAFPAGTHADDPEIFIFLAFLKADSNYSIRWVYC